MVRAPKMPNTVKKPSAIPTVAAAARPTALSGPVRPAESCPYTTNSR
ncbi:Uncharacterised protein [Mycobacterium tuberculosis]|uniref:Uncharacterized protein n=1 Tax=Mycobacterium tuberculosis TaxID=1773 RepID=A0A655JHG0_MYCTX|nr:Uncharacterised protein [Mycobacterium tuberculosis]COZ51227.1 Uncharacterised protein [Mycobacterium tuberculosis]